MICNLVLFCASGSPASVFDTLTCLPKFAFKYAEKFCADVGFIVPLKNAICVFLSFVTVLIISYASLAAPISDACEISPPKIDG